MTREEAEEVIQAAGDTRGVVEAELALREYLRKHPGNILKAGELLHIMKSAIEDLGEWDADVERAVLDAAKAPALAKSA